MIDWCDHGLHYPSTYLVVCTKQNIGTKMAAPARLGPPERALFQLLFSDVHQTGHRNKDGGGLLAWFHHGVYNPKVSIYIGALIVTLTRK